jgi:hypothetical protein
VVSIRTWNPRESPSGEVDFDDVRRDLADLPHRFPGLTRVLVDAAAESSSVLPWARQHPRLSLLVEPFTATADSNMQIWSALVARLNARTIVLPRHERLLSELRGLRAESFAFGSRFRVVDSSRRFHRDVSFALALAVFAAGARACTSPMCTDPECDGQPPWGLASSPYVEAWFGQHPEGHESDDADDETEDTQPTTEAPAAPMDSALAVARHAAGVVGQLGWRVTQQMAQASDAVLPRDDQGAARRTEARRQRRLVRQRESSEREQADAERRRRDAAVQALADHIRRHGSYFPCDRR